MVPADRVSLQREAVVHMARSFEVNRYKGDDDRAERLRRVQEARERREQRRVESMLVGAQAAAAAKARRHSGKVSASLSAQS